MARGARGEVVSRPPGAAEFGKQSLAFTPRYRGLEEQRNAKVRAGRSNRGQIS